MLAIGYNNYLAKSQILSIHDTCTGINGQATATSKPIRKLIEEARRTGIYVNCCRGHKRRSIVITKKYMYASIIAAKTLEMHWRGEKHD